MKTNKKFLAIAAVGAIAVSLGALAACEPADDTNKKPSNGDPQIVYQFTGEFSNDTLNGYGFAYSVMLNLYDNNKVSGSGYNYLTMDTRPAAENSGFAEKWFRGSWEVSKDDEDQDCIKLKVIYDEDAKNGMTGGTLSNTSEYFLYKKKGSEALGDFRLQSPIFSGTTEYMTNMSQNAKPYKTADEFIAANEFKESLPTDYKAVFASTDESQVASKIYLLDGGKAPVYNAKKNPANNEVKYAKGETWEWTYADGALKVISTTNGTRTPYDATVSGNTATLEFSVTLYGGTTLEYKYACSDISKLAPTV